MDRIVKSDLSVGKGELMLKREGHREHNFVASDGPSERPDRREAQIG